MCSGWLIQALNSCQMVAKVFLLDARTLLRHFGWLLGNSQGFLDGCDGVFRELLGGGVSTSLY